MNGKQSAVMWMGIILVFTRLFTTNQWNELWSFISSGSAKDPNVGPSQHVTPGKCPPGQTMVNGHCVVVLS